MPNPKVGSDRDAMAPRGVPSPKDTFKSGMQPDHPTLKPKTNYQERKGAGTAVPIPPELNLP